jgi:rSAM/selenodomain-associated transferase 2
MRVSVVVPTLEEADRVGALIEALGKDGFEEVIVSDGASVDTTRDIARAAGAIVVEGPRGRGSQLQRGADAASGDILFFLHADSTPPPGARALIQHTLAAPGISAGCFRLVFDRPHPLLSLYGAMSRINHDLFTYGDQGFFIPRAVFDRIGGYTNAPLFEDVDIVRRARRAGRFIKLGEPMTTSARRFLQSGIARRQLANAGLVALYTLGVPPRRLALWYRPESPLTGG